MVSVSKQIGSIFLIIGTSLGGGILAIPMLLSYFGAIPGTIIMFLLWLLMTYSTLAIAEACQHFEKGISFLGLAHKLFGRFGIVLVYICSFGILYGMLTAYISATGSTFQSIFGLNHITSELLFVAIFGAFILKGTKHAEWLNRFFLSTKLIIIIIALVLLLKTVNIQYLELSSFDNLKQLCITLPVLATTFSAHVIIPTVRNYVGDNPKEIRRIIMIASLIILSIYTLWIITIFGNIAIFGGENSFQTFLANHSSQDAVIQFLAILKVNIDSHFIITAVYTFISISVTTAFITLSLALKDLILDRSKIKDITNPKRTIILSFLLFILPIIINYYFEKLFLMALSVVGLFSLIMLVTCPLNMVRLLRNQGYALIYSSMKNRFLNIFAITVSITIIIFQILDYLS